MARSWQRVVCACALSLAGCDSPATQLVVLVDTDFEVTGELARVHARVLDAEGREVSGHELALAATGVDAGPARFHVPLSFAVVPLGGDAGRRIVVEVDGLDPGGELLVRRRAVTGFIEHERLLLPMFLASACAGTTCEPGQTCTERGCADEVVPPGTLTVVGPGDEVRRDGGPAEGGPVCEEEVLCDETACRCATDCCELTCPGSCTASCDRGETCLVSAEDATSIDVACRMATECVVDARGAEDVSVSCMLSSCAVDCTGAGACGVTCNVGAECVVRCGGAGDCTVSSCPEVVSCPDGVLACRTGCP